MTATPQRYSHPSSRTGQHRTARGHSHRGTVLMPRTAPASPGTPDPQPGRARTPQQGTTGTEARGFVVYVGMSEEAAVAAGTSLTRLATELRHYVESVVPGAQTAAAVAVVRAGVPGADVDVVRQALGDPTAPPGDCAAVVLTPAPAPAGQQGILIDLPGREVHLDGESLNLTHKEFALLNFLVENGGRIVRREELLEALWDDVDGPPNERTIDVHIRRLRCKLGRLASTVHTVRGEGYRFSEHPDVMVRPAPEYCI